MTGLETRRTTRALGIALLLTVAGSAAASGWMPARPPARTASAKAPPEDSDPNDQPKITLGPNASYGRQYGPIATQNAAFNQTNMDLDPATCRQLQETFCNVIPVDFVAPKGLRKADTFLATLTLSWLNAAGVCDVPALGCVEGEELDLYLWPNPEGTTNTTISIERDLSGSEPKTMYIDLTTGLHYQLVVVHEQGSTNPGGYHLEVSDRYVPFVPPTESTDVTPPASPPPAISPAPPPPLAPAPTTTLPQASAAPSNRPPLASPAEAVDPSLVSLTGASADAALAAAPNIFKQPKVNRPPGPVSGLAALVGLGLVPLVLIAFGAVAFRRRRPISLSMRNVDTA
jgi:hypothetical protein